MTDLDPAIWDNPTLGAAAHNERLDRLELQQHEDRAARLEDREPREVVVDNTYPGWTPEVQERTGTVPSNYRTVHYADENQNDVPVDSAPSEETAAGLADVNDSEGTEVSDGDVEENTSEMSTAEEPYVESDGTDSSEEGNSTQWT
ncbi:hypothetical protein [Streptomyces griseosporeus]|uniref:hypothetical protein n=1 Tax=Streptomyces griseosporeus TaxID=1910 RepID=UPI00167E859D|nr:hypothetical protein [Streptomyces griseosporeus]GHF92053.1 hypothetical protein GCM10018783_73600 [Streptomyces griseosporeus]